MVTVTNSSKHAPLCKSVDNIFSSSNNIIFQKRNTIKIVDYNNEQFVVKKFKTPHHINKLAYGLIRDSKAKKSYLNSLRLQDFTPAPIGYAESKKAGLLFESYYISEYFDYDFTIREPLTTTDYPNKPQIYKAFAIFTKELHDAGIMHLDYSPGNILIKKSKDGYVFKVIDVNRMKFKELDPNDRLASFSKLWASDDDMSIIMGYYANAIDTDKASAIQTALRVSQAHKDKINFKKRLKGKPVVD